MKSLGLVLAVLFVAFLFNAPAYSDDKKFQKDLDSLRSQMSKGKWRLADKKLTALLKEHAGQGYTRSKRAELEECIKACAFWRNYSPPKLKELISGDLISYKKSTGAIKLKYAWDQIGDFESPEKDKKAPPLKRVLLHPLNFSGPYTIEIKGKRYPPRIVRQQPIIMLICGEKNQFQINFGYNLDGETTYIPASIAQHDGEEWDTVDYVESSPCKAGKPYHIKISVTSTKVTASFGKKKLLQAKKAKNLYGSFYIRGYDFDSLLIQGKVQPAWLQGKLDDHSQAAKAVFEKDYRRKEYLPSWLLNETKLAKKEKSKSEEREYPGPETSGQEAIVSKCIDFFNKDENEAGVKHIKSLTDKQVTKEVRAYCLALLYEGLENYEQALKHCMEVCEADPEFFPAQLKTANLYSLSGKVGDAETKFNQLIGSYPLKESVYEALAQFYLRMGEPEKAKLGMEKALANNISSKRIDKLNKELYHVINGPSWDKVYEAKSKHYHVFSNIDKDVCYDAVELLEQAYVSYSAHLDRVQEQRKKRFPVYLFSGKAGFNSYTKLFGSEPGASVAGLYYPSLKQLLIWNLPDRDTMFRTIRHEGFHQYLDSLTVVDPPIWFNEGLAEYYELARLVRGQWKLGEIHPAHRRVFKQTKGKTIPLKQFLYLSTREFYKNSTLNYAQGWALIHFLRNTSNKNRKLFNMLFKKLQRNVPARTTLEEVFKTVDLDKFEEEFIAHVKGFIG